MIKKEDKANILDKNRIYKYLPISVKSIQLLITNDLWFGHPENLNDPYEYEFICDEHLTEIQNKRFVKFFYSELRKVPGYLVTPGAEMLYPLPQEIFNRDLDTFVRYYLKSYYGVSCFTYDPYSILMWSHYADSHKGICIAFDKELLINSIKEVDQTVTVNDIKYSSEIPKIKISLSKGKIKVDSTQKIISNKLNHWKYEREIRIIKKIEPKKDSRILTFNRNAIVGVIFGYKCSMDHMRMITKLLTNSKGSEFKTGRWGIARTDLLKRKMHIGVSDWVDPKYDFDIQRIYNL